MTQTQKVGVYCISTIMDKLPDNIHNIPIESLRWMKRAFEKNGNTEIFGYNEICKLIEEKSNEKTQYSEIERK